MTIRNRHRRVRRTEPVPWVGLSLRSEPYEIAIAGFARSYRDALAKAEIRVRGCTHYEAFPICDAMGEQIMAWLLKSGASREDSIEAVRDIGRELLRVFA